MASIGVALVIAAIAADQRWFDRHLIPSLFLPRHWYAFIYTAVRWSTATLGISLAFGARPLAARLSSETPRRALEIAMAAALALGASELVLRRVHLRPTAWLLVDEEPRRRSDPWLGWTIAPARTGHTTIGGRTIDYAVDAAGCRVRRVEEPVDPERPTILFTGESVMFGEGLTWEETIPAQVGAAMNLQTANLAVHGFSTDQAFLRLRAELPRFRRPVAVVSLFMTALFGRNLDDDRPHLGPGLVWTEAKQHARLVSLAGLLIPYRRDETVERGIDVTQAVLRATVVLAQGRGAMPLILVPQLDPEEQVERTLRRRILDEAALPYIFVEIDAEEHLPEDRHPNARAARAIAAAVAARLEISRPDSWIK